MATLADALTAVRALIALLLVAMVGQGRLDVAAALLATAWLTDFLDGKSARAATRPSHLGHLDLAVDTLVGAGLMIGLSLGGYVNWGIGLLIVVLLGGGWIALKNTSLSSALQAIAYGWFMWLTYSRAVDGWWLPPAIIAIIATLNWHRFIHDSIPGFFAGIADLFSAARRFVERTS